MLPKLSEIKEMRKRLGLTQSELARIAGVSQSLIAKIEKNKIDPAYSKVRALFQALWSVGNVDKKIAKHVMNKPVIWVYADELVDTALKKMLNASISQMPVLDRKGNLIGSLSEEKLIEGFENGFIVHGKTQAYDVLDEAFPQVGEKTQFSALFELLKFHKAVLVVKKGKIIGIITKSDLLRNV